LQSCFFSAREPGLVAFMSTRVRDVDDYKKLARSMRYLRATSKLKLTLQAEDLSKMNWWVDASFAVHPNMRSHTGVVLSFGDGAIYGPSSKQKLNTRSWTEAELVGVNDALPQVLWTRQFLIGQGFRNRDPVIFQDNQSAMFLEKHGRLLSGKRTCHIDVRYYFVKDRIASKEVRVEYCPTGDMLADYFTKPLQGGLFVKFCNMIVNSHSDPAWHGAILDHRSMLRNEWLGSALTINQSWYHRSSKCESHRHKKEKGVLVLNEWMRMQQREKCTRLKLFQPPERKWPIKNLLIIYFKLTYCVKFYTCH